MRRCGLVALRSVSRLNAVGRRSMSHFQSVSTDELRQIVVARGMKAPPAEATREELEKMLVDAPAVADPNEEAYGAILGLKASAFTSPSHTESHGPQTFVFASRNEEMKLCGDGYDAEMTGRFGTVLANAAIDWADRRSGPVTVFVTERPEAAGIIPLTFRRRDSGLSDSGKMLGGLVNDVIQAAQLADGFPHPTRVTTHSLVSKKHFNPMAHVSAACHALRMRGYPIAPVGTARVGMSADGEFINDPDTEATEKGVAIASCVVVRRSDGEFSICHAEVDSKFRNEEEAMLLAARAYEAAKDQCEELAKATVPWREIQQGVSVPSDWIAMFPTSSVSEAVQRVVRDMLVKFTSQAWPGEDGMLALLAACEMRAAAVVKERVSWWDLRTAVRYALGAMVRETRRKTGLAPAIIEINKSIRGSRMARVTHGAGPAAAVYSTQSNQRSTNDMAPESCRPPSLYEEPQVTCHVDLNAAVPVLLAQGDRQRGGNMVEQALAFAAPWFSDRPTFEGRISIVATREGAAWDLAYSALLGRSDTVEEQAAPSLAVWEDGSTTVRPDPLQSFCAPAVVTVCGTNSNKIGFIRLAASPSWWLGSADVKPVVSFEQFRNAVKEGVKVAATEVTEVIRPLLQLQVKPTQALVVGRGLVNRMEKSSRFKRTVKELLGTGSLEIKAADTIEIDRDAEMPADWKWKLGPTWEDFSQGVDAVVRSGSSFGVFVHPRIKGKEYDGLSGLLHISKAGPGGTSIIASRLPADNKVIRVRVGTWTDQGPRLERCEKDWE